jgi:hypothetical protein
MAKMRNLGLQNISQQPGEGPELPYNEAQSAPQGPPLLSAGGQDLSTAHIEQSQEDGRAATKPRDNPDMMGTQGSLGMGGAQAAPSRPRSPQPMAGSTFSPPPPTGGVIPFEPMGDTSGVSLARGRIFGKQGGLQGGGLGMPLDPMANEASDPIAMLMQLLQGGKRGI